MKKYVLTLTICILFTGLYKISHAQLSEGGLPISFSYKDSEIGKVDFLKMPFVDIEALRAEDQYFDTVPGIPFRFGYNHEVDFNMENSGDKHEFEDGSFLWRLGIKSENALSINLSFKNFEIPKGSQLFIYNEDKTHVLGAFSHRNNQYHRYFSTTLVNGDAIIIEYFEPYWAEFRGDFNLWRVTHGYRGPHDFVKSFGSSGNCNLNVACPESAGWEDQINSVAIMVTGGSGFCTGSLVNNTNNDGTPYFLTADHCFSNPANWVFWFNWQSETCNNPPSSPDYNSLSGATLRARHSASDFCLVELNDEVPLEYNPFFSGWNRTTDASVPAPIIGIHHPAGDIKKFSWSDFAVDKSGYLGGPGSGTTHWRVSSWSGETTTEPGSSGSGLWDSNGLLIGQLHGGYAACGNTDPDWYGIFGVSWEGGGSIATRLKDWLDPGNTDVMTLQGLNPLGSTPSANFSGNPLSIPVGDQVEFTDMSLGNPTSWAWTFQGGNPPASSAQNPTVTYNTPGAWNVSLTVTSAEGSDTETKAGYVTVYEVGELIANFIAQPAVLNAGTNSQFIDLSSGPPTAWEWEFEGGVPATSTDQSPQINYPDPGIYSVTLTVSDGTDTHELVRNDYVVVLPPGAGELHAHFISSATQIIQGQCIDFYDQSHGNPESWNWNFPGATPVVSSSQNPTGVCYNQPGIYDVCLHIMKGSNSNTYCCQECIEVLPDPNLPKVDFVANHTTIPVGGIVMFTNLSVNGPYTAWSWTFQGGTPHQVNDSAPGPIAYHQPGLYSVELRGKPMGSNQVIEIKQDYINVVPPATGPPQANFEANYTFISPGQSVNFIDYSTGSPYIWNWEFTGGTPATSNVKNPQNIQYQQAGVYPVKLTVSNNFGADEITKESYILVNATDTCTKAPEVKFSADNRLIATGGTVGFINESKNNPSTFSWFFEGGNPSTSSERNPSTRIKYQTPGIYTVRLTANNACGSEIVEKEKYVYVFSGTITKYCDTLNNVRPNELFQPYSPPNFSWGHLAGHNSDNIRGYADYFDTHSFSHIEALLVPVHMAVYGTYLSQVRFYIWDGDTNKPLNILGEKRVNIMDLIPGQTNIIKFDNPVEVNGPFYLGYTISYTQGTINDYDNFVVGIVQPRGNNPHNNTLFVQQGGEWYTANQRYGFSSSLPIRPISCIVDIQEFISDLDIDVYPNPTTGLVNISLGDFEYRNAEISVFDLLGRKVNTGVQQIFTGHFTIDLSNYPDGMYIINIKTDTAVFNKKLLLTK